MGLTDSSTPQPTTGAGCGVLLFDEMRFVRPGGLRAARPTGMRFLREDPDTRRPDASVR